MSQSTENIVAHTPGPWRVETTKWRNHIGMPRTTRDIRAVDRPIATMSSLSDNDDETEGNARLIAAAPDLLAIAHQIYMPLSEGTFYQDYDEGMLMVGRLRRAIAQAEGRQS